MKKETAEMLTAKQFAERAEVSYPTVMKWLRAELIPGAQKVESPIGEYWEIPATSLAHVSKRKPGPKPGTKQKKKRASKKSNDGVLTADPPEKVTRSGVTAKSEKRIRKITKSAKKGGAAK